jgi:hydroxymethylpyrimidine kinase/phosphomethylpyrimidine kinase/thiamine-phosphate diphosphorylase
VQQSPRPVPIIVYTIAGSDSGGGAGIQADMHAMKAFGVHPCTIITCLTAQNSMGVTAIHSPPSEFLRAQWQALITDLPPVAIKIGMLGTRELAMTVGEFLQEIKSKSDNHTDKVWVVLDPVMRSTSGSKLLDDDAQQALIEHIFPYVDIITPNKLEAEALLNRELNSAADVEQAARDLLNMGVPAVLIKGGHSTNGDNEDSFADDYFLQNTETIISSSSSSSLSLKDSEPRLCDGNRGVWLRSPRYATIHTHGTGCTLSSSIAAALAFAQTSSSSSFQHINDSAVACCTKNLDLVDACCLAKAYVTAGIFYGVQLGQGPGPVAQTVFPNSHQHFPSIPSSRSFEFLRMKILDDDDETDDDRPSLGRILPIVDSIEWVQRLCDAGGVSDIQLRIKGENSNDPLYVSEMVATCQEICSKSGVRLWINDHWKAAVESGCFGVHVGQEDLFRCMEAGGLEILHEKHIALGISTHSFGELAVALGVRPSYISLGPIFATTSKNVRFHPQGLGTIQKWRELIPSDTPLVAIGGIGDADTAARVRAAGAGCVAVIGAITSRTNLEDVRNSMQSLNLAMQYKEC